MPEYDKVKCPTCGKRIEHADGHYLCTGCDYTLDCRDIQALLWFNERASVKICALDWHPIDDEISILYAGQYYHEVCSRVAQHEAKRVPKEN